MTTSQRSEIRQLLSRSENYQLYRYLPDFDETAADGSFVDLARDDGLTMLAPRPFTRLLNIRPGYYLFHQEMECWIELYTPSRFARQFGYNQFLVKNPNQSLRCTGSPSQASRYWFYSIAGCTRARFMLPKEGHTLRQSFEFCRWYSGVNQSP